ncbi:hypothetical protein BDV30DRAFT_212894 [Aspergillus minisclerotigenes]|uniref:Uncharacterized protein n=1 Tax=Aspergillus minisclerotigenes TaxID=656917 RepID=A0A5N6IZ09_9EURO|nr:hypothetical protein BDV30DRAFT_212894 [Aspergillus minisclerotigenes]
MKHLKELPPSSGDIVIVAFRQPILPKVVVALVLYSTITKSARNAQLSATRSTQILQ